jgi:XTP/dITP diphosphohydrolase
MEKTTIYLATNNAHKVQEIMQIIGDGFELKTLADLNHTTELPETGNTFYQNSAQKAQLIHDTYGVNVMADDSGLEIEALNGRPGVDSAHYAGPQRSHAHNMALVLDEMKGVANRNAQFTAVISLIYNGFLHQFEGTVQGSIRLEKTGTDGFGYDPIFEPKGYNITFAEMTAEQKNTVSHRKNALLKLEAFFKNNA